MITLHHKAFQATKYGCTTQQFAVGSSGKCVKDIQTMVDYMETAGLNECPFEGTKILTITGAYNKETANQVRSVQQWIHCYSAQEESQTNVSVNGKVDAATWQLLCSFGFRFPSQSNSSTSSYRQSALSAGKNAGC